LCKLYTALTATHIYLYYRLTQLSLANYLCPS